MHRTKQLLTAVLVLLAPCALLAQSGTENPFHWKGALGAGKTLTLKDVNGNIHVDTTGGNQVEVTANKSGRDADQVRIDVVQQSDGIAICAEFPGVDSGSCNSGSDSHVDHHGDMHARVDFTVHLPRDVRLVARNVNGSVDAKDLGEVADATSVNGSVDVTTAQWAHLSSVNGNVVGHFGRADWPDQLDISTVNGNITLALPADAATEVDFQSVNGRLHTDLPLTIQSSSGRYGPQRLHGTIGSGGRQLKIRTVNGSAELEKNTM